MLWTVARRFAVDARSGSAQPRGGKRSPPFRASRVELAAQSAFLCFQLRKLQLKRVQLPSLLLLLGLATNRVTLYGLGLVSD